LHDGKPNVDFKGELDLFVAVEPHPEGLHSAALACYLGEPL